MAKELTEKQEKLLVLFRSAIENERAAQEEYGEMLLVADEPTLKSLIESFIEQERRHEETLTKKYAELRKTDEFRDVT
ncbi:MAG: hypothetical protein ACYCXJ_06860 [Thermoleophilia bacterium]